MARADVLWYDAVDFILYYVVLTDNIACMFLRFRRNDVQQFMRFGVIGVINTAIDWSMYFGLTRSSHFWSEHFLWANVMAFTTAASFSYVFNRRWTFKSDDRRVARQFIVFFIVSIGGLFVNEFVVFLSVRIFIIGDVAGKFIATLFSTLWNFFVNKHVTFNDKRSDAKVKRERFESEL